MPSRSYSMSAVKEKGRQLHIFVGRTALYHEISAWICFVRYTTEQHRSLSIWKNKNIAVVLQEEAHFSFNGRRTTCCECMPMRRWSSREPSCNFRKNTVSVVGAVAVAFVEILFHLVDQSDWMKHLPAYTFVMLRPYLYITLFLVPISMSTFGVGNQRIR